MTIVQDLMRAIILVGFCGLLIDAAAMGQSRDRKRETEATSAKVLELRLEKAEQALVDEYKLAAEELHKQGDKEKAIVLLQRLKQLNPKLDGLDQRMQAINEELMAENEDELELDTRYTEWKLVGDVVDGKPFRLQAAGEYRMTYTAFVGVEGLKPDEKAKDHIAGAPVGCLLGVIVAEGKDGTMEAGTPFPVGAALEQTPKKGGKLFLKMNVPEGTKCTGKIKVKVSGYIDTGKKR